MAESRTGQVESFETDKMGKKCATRTTRVARALKRDTDCKRLIIHDADTGRIGYTSKRSVVNDRMLDVARESGYRVDLISADTIETWDGHKKAVTIEFVPEVSDDE